MAQVEHLNTLGNFDHIKNVVDAFSHIFYIVNDQRQIVLSNIRFKKLADSNKLEEVLGLRTGDALGCLNAKYSSYGCGSTNECKGCGALATITEAFNSNSKVTSEAQIALEGNPANQLSLEITATPFVHNRRRYLYVSAIDIEEKQRKEIMEKIFFHDVLNLMTSMQGCLEIMDSMDTEGRERFFPRLKDLSNQLMEEINAQQELVKAENNQLVPNVMVTSSMQVIEDVKQKMSTLKVASEKIIVIDQISDKVTIKTDTLLLSRVLINMTKNALEASGKGESIVLKAQKISGGVRFSVHNNAVIPDQIRFNIFKRSVTTKGKGHGLGTYSMRLLGERYLNGQVGFTTDKKKGTDFYIEIPL